MQNNISNEEEILKFIRTIPELMKDIDNEEQTKISIIMPLLNMFGINTTNPKKFKAEYTADEGIRKNKKVDFAMIENTVPIVLIEAKSATHNLQWGNRDTIKQLEGYSNATENKISILTNGLTWIIFGSKENSTLMNTIPILTIHTERINNKNAVKNIKELITELKKLTIHKEKSTTINQILKKYKNKNYEKPMRRIIPEKENPKNGKYGYLKEINYINGESEYIISYDGKLFHKSINKEELIIEWYSNHQNIELIDMTKNYKKKKLELK